MRRRRGSRRHRCVARLSERLPDVRLTGRELDCAGAELVLLCVPDRAVAEVAGAMSPGPWVAHTSGAARLSALEPHRRRFTLHPLQTFTHELGPSSSTAPTGPSRPRPTRRWTPEWRWRALGLRPFELPDEERPAYHAAATFAAPFLVRSTRPPQS